MTNTGHASDAQCVDLFAALNDVTQCLVRLADPGASRPQFLTELGACLEQGWMLRTQFAVGNAGALMLTLTAVSPSGVIAEVVNIDAPPGCRPFKLASTNSSTTSS